MRRKRSWQGLIGAGLAALAIAATGCERKEGPFEEAGEKVDEAVDEAQDAVEDLGDR